uniref:MMPL family transporter n=1 Tax=Streptomyces sanglieri TaxID=193460 RepID=UPI0035265A05
TPGNEQIAFAMTLGILLSALVLSLVLVPALTALLGRSIWWPVRPRPSKRSHPQHRANAPAPEPDQVMMAD